MRKLWVWLKNKIISSTGKISFSKLRSLAQFRQNQRLGKFGKTMLFLNYIVISALFIAVIAKYISPASFWLTAFFGLAFPVFFLLNLLFIIYWILRFKYAFIFGFIGFAAALPTAYRYIQYSTPEKINETEVIKVTSYNSMLFDLYNWWHDKETRPKLFANLIKCSPDILCLQEFYTSEEKGDYNNIDTVLNKFNFSYFHAEYTETLRDYDHWGIAIFSKYPIIRRGKIKFKTNSNNICIYSDLIIKGDTVRVYNLHLQSISFSDANNKFLEEVVSEKDADNEVENSKSILRHLKRAFIKRSKQVNQVTAHMKNCRYKIILCGDFNDTAASYAYEQLSENLNDAFIEKGVGIGRTYAGKWPQFRIDYILHSKELKCVKFERSAETFTDHYPITACFEQ